MDLWLTGWLRIKRTDFETGVTFSIRQWKVLSSGWSRTRLRGRWPSVPQLDLTAMGAWADLAKSGPSLSGRSSSPSNRATPVGTNPSAAAAAAAPENPRAPRPQSRAQAAPKGSWWTCSRSWRWVRRAGGRRFRRCGCAGSSWRRERRGSCCRSPAGRPAASAAGSPPPASLCHRVAPESCCCSARTPTRTSSCRSIRFWGLICKPRRRRTCGEKRFFKKCFNDPRLPL